MRGEEFCEEEINLQPEGRKREDMDGVVPRATIGGVDSLNRHRTVVATAQHNCAETLLANDWAANLWLALAR